MTPRTPALDICHSTCHFCHLTYCESSKSLVSDCGGIECDDIAFKCHFKKVWKVTMVGIKCDDDTF